MFFVRMKVILDTNFLIYCAKERLDYIEKIEKLLNENYELVVPSSVVDELKKLSEDKTKKVSGKDKDACSLALQLLKANGIKNVGLKGKSVDDSIVELAGSDAKNVVCTLDREMRHALGRVILINKGKKLILSR
jgi:rRNA-processing protein FCF1